MPHPKSRTKPAIIPLKTAAAAAACLMAFAVASRAQDMSRYKASPIGSEVRIDGTSSVHDWTMVGKIIGGNLEVPSGVVLDPAKEGLSGVTGSNVAAHAEVSIPVNS